MPKKIASRHSDKVGHKVHDFSGLTHHGACWVKAVQNVWREEQVWEQEQAEKCHTRPPGLFHSGRDPFEELVQGTWASNCEEDSKQCRGEWRVLGERGQQGSDVGRIPGGRREQK
jgi:hypothetical protein